MVVGPRMEGASGRGMAGSARTAVVVGCHFLVEDAGLVVLAGSWYQKVLQLRKDIIADVVELLLDRCLVRFDQVDIARALLNLLGLDGADDAERGPACTDNIFVRHREKVALLE